MGLDLSATMRSGGPVAAAVELLEEWWRASVPQPPVRGGDLLEVLRSPDVTSQLRWPQDRVVPSGRRSLLGDEVVAEENQVLWVATRAAPSAARVTFAVDDGTVQVGPTMALDELLLRIMVEAAVWSGACLRCRLRSPDGIDRALLLKGVRLHPSVAFRTLVGGPGWIGLVRGVVTIAALDPPDEVMDHLATFGHDWHEYAELVRDDAVAREDVSSWHDLRALGGRAFVWRAVRR